MQDDPLKPFVDSLLEKSGRSGDDAARAEITNKIDEAVERALIEALPLDQLDKLDEAVKKGIATEEMVDELLIEGGVDTNSVIEQAMHDFEEDYLKGAN